MTEPEFWKEYNKKLANSPKEWRRGQSCFNALSDLNPTWAEEIRGTKLDPFHKRNEDLCDFFKWLYAKLRG